MDQKTLSELHGWIGRHQEADDLVTAAKYAALAATLNRDEGWPPSGTPLPPLWHWMLCVPIARQSELGADGHPQRGGFLPPVPLPRRMWAGGRLVFIRPLRVGEPVHRGSRIASVQHKRGRSGDLVFVVVSHELSGPNGLALIEEHDIVYRDAPQRGTQSTAGTPAPTTSAWKQVIKPDDVLLFRYSALTFNGHRIHYDRRYVTEIEGYPGLIVHGPLIATLLLELLHHKRPGATVERFEFRAAKPLFDIEPFTICGQPSENARNVKLWAHDSEGWLAMDATATLR